MLNMRIAISGKKVQRDGKSFTIKNAEIVEDKPVVEVTPRDAGIEEAIAKVIRASMPKPPVWEEILKALAA